MLKKEQSKIFNKLKSYLSRQKHYFLILYSFIFISYFNNNLEENNVRFAKLETYK